MFNCTALYRHVYRFSRKNAEQLPTTCPRVYRAWQKLQYRLVLNVHLNVFVTFAEVLFKYLITKLQMFFGSLLIVFLQQMLK